MQAGQKTDSGIIFHWVLRLNKLTASRFKAMSIELLLLITVLATAEVFAEEQNSENPKAREFFALLKSNFAGWDLNHNNILTGDEITNCIENPAVRGKNAAALAALKTLERFSIRNTGTYSDFTPLELENLRQSFAYGDKEARGLVKCYHDSLLKLSRQAKKLFTGDCAHINGIKQGHTSDCYFLSVVGSMVSLDPQSVARYIKCNEDGTYSVSFYGSNPIRVNRPTDGEIATYTDSGGDGYWLTVLEKAYGILKSKEGFNHKPPVEPLDDVATHGSSTVDVIYAFTGHASSPYSLRNSLTRDLIRQILADASKNKRLAVTTVPGHCLAFISYDQNSDSVRIWNPWGSTKFYKAAGTMMNDGYLTLTVDDYLSRFGHVFVELDKKESQGL